MSEYPSMYDAAIEYAKKGFAVFPLKYRDKVPLTRNGCKDATTDAAQIKAWWQKYPNANIGLATGSVSQNVFVIDLDIDEDRGIDGYHSLEDWQREHGDFPETWTAITGRGGYHLYYRGNGKIKNRAGIIDGVDIRGNGGYVVAPPSIHKNGNRYEWEYSPDEFEIAKADNNVEYFLNHDDQKQGAAFTMPNIVAAGQRNQMLFRFACMMQAKGASDQSVFAATMAENESSCSPPLTEQEVKVIVSSATRYDKGKPIHIDSEGVATRENKDDVIGNPEWVLNFLDCNHDKDGNIKSVKQFVHNFEIVMDKDDRFAGKIRFNEFAQQLYLCGNVPWEKEDNCRAWSSHDDSALFSLIQADYGLKSRQDFADALKNVSMRNKFHPVRELLDSLTWDGKEHIRSLLPEYLGAEDSDYTYQVMRLWMLGAVSRVYKPGNKFDYTIILQGSQGIGKSTFLKLMALDDSWFNDSLDSLDSDKAVQSLTGSWIIELAELKSLARTAGGVESVKRFLTATQDKYRIPYERRADTFYRQCVFAGTTNKDDFLQDETGNRRFLIVQTGVKKPSKSLFVPEIMDTIKLAWAEAVHIWKNEKPQLILPEAYMQEANELQEANMADDGKRGIIQEYLEGKTQVCAREIWEKALGENVSPRKYQITEINDIIAKVPGWKKLKSPRNFEGYGKQRGFQKTVLQTENEKATNFSEFVPISRQEQMEIPFD
ncbi:MULTISPECIES: VapE domain-containing protein [Blautia]|uniref:VapE domain-containing protein n=1 Tax=Blautia TaxID=572511 RepID=UPI0018AB34C0|nr:MULTISPECIES: VapE domain-containing protein [Blautia]MDB6459779.1 VapE family protein [Blautia wexlerae]MDB6462998.1 VapE family protein [Blautia wexlerae]MDB6466352.1 VapE family protein [Blautia wexlerae]